MFSSVKISTFEESGIGAATAQAPPGPVNRRTPAASAASTMPSETFGGLRRRWRGCPAHQLPASCCVVTSRRLKKFEVAMDTTSAARAGSS
jgi:hypothetical protein